jgi:hypothetical protein
MGWVEEKQAQSGLGFGVTIKSDESQRIIKGGVRGED